MKEYKYKINGNLYKVAINSIEDNIANIEVNGTPYTVEMEKPAKETPDPQPTVSRPAAPKAEVGETVVARPAAGASKSAIKSPLPGVVVDIKVKVGDVVKKGQTLLILEAMKMENNINADKDGTVSAININSGDSVLEGTDLVVVE